jgi:putative peptidoglycan lipid II flippase
MALLKSIATVGSFTMMSRVLGFVREILIANVIGPGMIADAFIFAFKFPNFFRRMFAEGAFNAAFVPLYAGRHEQEGEAAARRFAGEVASVMAGWMLLFTLLAMAAMPWIMMGLAWGWIDEPEKFDLTVSLTRITFPYLLFMVLTAMLSGMLNALGRFAAAAAAPILLNIVLIAVLLLVRAGWLSMPGHALAWGVAIAGIGQFLWLAWSCYRMDVLPPLPRPRLSPGVRRLFALMLPGVLGAGVVHINLLVDVFLATLLPEGSLTYLYLADRVNQFPLGVVGVSVGVALLPTMSRQLRAGDPAAAAHNQNRAVEFALFLAVPAAAAFVAIGGPIVAVMYQHGETDAAEARAIAQALAAFAVGLPAAVLIKAFQPGFYAREDTVTPFKVTLAAVALNVVLAVALMQLIQHSGIALATSLSYWFSAGALGLILHRRGQLRFDARVRRRVPMIVFCACVMGLAVWWLALALADPLGGPLWQRIGALAAIVIAGASIYTVLAFATGATRVSDLSALRRRGNGGSETD